MRPQLRVGPRSYSVGSIDSSARSSSRESLQSFAEKDAAELRQLTAALAYELRSELGEA